MESKRLPGAVRLTAKQSFPAALTVRQVLLHWLYSAILCTFCIESFVYCRLALPTHRCDEPASIGDARRYVQWENTQRKGKLEGSWKPDYLTSLCSRPSFSSDRTVSWMSQKHFFFSQVVWTLVCRAHGFEKFITDTSLKEQCPSYLVPQFRSP